MKDREHIILEDAWESGKIGKNTFYFLMKSKKMCIEPEFSGSVITQEFRTTTRIPWGIFQKEIITEQGECKTALHLFTKTTAVKGLELYEDTGCKHGLNLMRALGYKLYFDKRIMQNIEPLDLDTVNYLCENEIMSQTERASLGSGLIEPWYLRDLMWLPKPYLDVAEGKCKIYGFYGMKKGEEKPVMLDTSEEGRSFLGGIGGLYFVVQLKPNLKAEKIGTEDWRIIIQSGNK